MKKRNATMVVAVIENFDGFRGTNIGTIERKARTSYATNYSGGKLVYRRDGVKVSYKGKCHKVHFSKEYGSFISVTKARR